MKFNQKLLVLTCALLFAWNGSAQKKDAVTNKYAFAIHGGAGTITKSKMTPELEKAYTSALNEALRIGQQVLDTGGLAIDAVESAVRYLEDSPLFNAGKGAVFNHEGKNEMDAAIMDGRDLSCGSLTGVTCLKNPISGARLVKDSSEHVFLSGDSGQAFCVQRGAECVDSTYFFTEYRWNQLLKAREKDSVQLDHSMRDPTESALEKIEKFGTVGAVALDKYGNLAAATSTGGLTNKQNGRIGDSPIIGAGTYANNNTCAISCTGKGEYFIRGTIARDVSAGMEFGKLSLKKSAQKAIEKLEMLNGSGGFVAVDKNGKIVMLFNTKGMYRASVKEGEPVLVEMYEAL